MPTKAIRATIAGLLTLLAIVFPWLTLHATGPWAPFAAQRLSRVYRVTASGKVLINETRQICLRNSRGSLYQRNIRIKVPDLQKEPTSVKLFDNTTGITYRILYSTKSVLVVGEHGPAVPLTSVSFHQQFPKDRFIGRKIIDGIECEGWRITWGITEAHPYGGDAGVIWVAPSLNFFPLESVTNGNGIEVDSQVTEIQPGTEPDSRFFQLPAGFSISRLIRQ